MKKIISLVLSFIMVCCSVPVLAVEKTDTVYYDTVTEIDEGFLFTKTETLRTNGGKDDRTIENKMYTYLVPTSDEARLELRNAINKNSRAELVYELPSKWDETRSFKLDMTIIIETKYVDNNPYAKIISASGGFSGASGTTGNYVGSGVYIDEHYVEAKSHAATATGTSDEIDIMNINPGTRTWNYTAPSDWDYVMIGNDAYYLRVIYSVTARRGTTTWTTTLGRNFV